jgi:hypothetical protein
MISQNAQLLKNRQWEQNFKSCFIITAFNIDNVTNATVNFRPNRDLSNSGKKSECSNYHTYQTLKITTHQKLTYDFWILILHLQFLWDYYSEIKNQNINI